MPELQLLTFLKEWKSGKPLRKIVVYAWLLTKDIPQLQSD